MTNRRDTEVWEMSVMDFFAWVAYSKRKHQKEEERLRKMNAKYGRT